MTKRNYPIPAGIEMSKVNSFIDRCLIDQYADKDLNNGYTLDIDLISQNDLSHFLDMLMSADTAIRDSVHDYMQHLIDKRLVACEESDKFGLSCIEYRDNGEKKYLGNRIC